MVWIGSTLTGLTHLKPGTGRSGMINITNGLANNVVLSIAEDRENNLWVGTGSGGLHKLVARRFFNFGLEQGLPNPIVRTVVESAPGNFIVGTHGGGIARLKNGRTTLVRAATNAAPMASAFVWSALRDHDGRIWLGTFNGGLLYEQDGVVRPFTNWPRSLGLTINCLYEDAQRRIWAGTHSGLGIIEKKRARPWATDTNNPLANANVRCLAEDLHTGALWIGTYYDGIFQLKDGRLIQFGPAQGVPPWHVSALNVDMDGNLWAGIYAHGLVCIHDGKVFALNRTNGLPADTIGSMIEDGLGYYWMGSDRGILRVAAEDLRRFIRDPANLPAFNVFDRNDGLVSLQSAEAMQPTALRDTSGKLWFATQKGLASITPARLRLNTNAPNVIIERVTYDDDGKKIVVENPGAETIAIKAGASDLKIDYAALSYTAPEKIQFDCRLERPRQVWRETDRSRSQIFHSLEPGEYRFTVRAANNDGVWNSRETGLRFVVEPFVWQRLWFWAAVAIVLAAGIGFAGWRFALIQLQRQLAQLNLQRERVRLAAVMEATTDLVVFADEQENILHINPAGRRLLGMNGPETEPLKKLSDLHPAKEYERMKNEVIPSSEMKGTWQGESVVRDAAGHDLPVSQVVIVHKDTSGRVDFVSLIARDISERKSAEERQARLEEQLRQAQKMEAVGQLSGGVAHDFNNLLAVISGNVSLLELDSTLLPDQREALNEIKLSSERAAALTRQLLAFSRRQAIQPRNVDLNGIVENMGKMIHRILGEPIRMGLEFSPAPALIHADAGMMEQILLNLVVNGRDAMPAGGELKITIARTDLDVTAAAAMPLARAGKFITLSVADTGAGIAPEILTRIFEPFFTTKDVGKGTGLGLATVYGIVQQHKGWVQVQSQPNRGTVFRIYFPRLPDSARVETERTQASKVSKGTETILLAEDEPALRKLIVRALSRQGYQILEAESGVQAEQIWEKHQAKIQLLLTDMVMPDGVGGRELARRLLVRQPNLKVIFMSGYDAAIVGQESGLVEGVNFIPKPFDQNVLSSIVRKLLDA